MENFICRSEIAGADADADADEDEDNKELMVGGRKAFERCTTQLTRTISILLQSSHDSAVEETE